MHSWPSFTPLQLLATSGGALPSLHRLKKRERQSWGAHPPTYSLCRSYAARQGRSFTGQLGLNAALGWRITQSPAPPLRLSDSLIQHLRPIVRVDSVLQSQVRRGVTDEGKRKKNAIDNSCGVLACAWINANLITSVNQLRSSVL